MKESERVSDNVMLQTLLHTENVTVQPIQYCILYFLHVSLGLPRLSAKFGRILVSEC